MHLHPGPSLGISGPCFCPDTWFFLLRAAGTKILSLDQTCGCGESLWMGASPAHPLPTLRPSSQTPGVAEPGPQPTPLSTLWNPQIDRCMGAGVCCCWPWATLNTPAPFFPAESSSRAELLSSWWGSPSPSSKQPRRRTSAIHPSGFKETFPERSPTRGQAPFFTQEPNREAKA